MPTIQHNVLVGNELHEPKGINTATLEQVYFADGNGSGVWVRVFNHGFEIIADNQGTQSLNTTMTPVKNNGAGPRSNSSFRFPSAGAVWNISTDSFNWAAAGAKVGDTIELFLDVTFNTTGSNRVISGDIQVGVGTTSVRTEALPIITKPTAENFDHTYHTAGVIDSNGILTGPAQFRLKSSNAGDTVEVNAFTVTIRARNPVVAP